MVYIDKATCDGCGICVALCSDVFEWDGENKARVKEGADQNHPDIPDTIDSCPTSSIKP